MTEGFLAKLEICVYIGQTFSSQQLSEISVHGKTFRLK